MPKKSRIASQKRAHAGSCSSSMWFLESSSMNCAFGMAEASSRPCDKGTAASSRACRISVGARNLGQQIDDVHFRIGSRTRRRQFPRRRFSDRDR